MLLQFNTISNNPILLLSGNMIFADKTHISIPARILCKEWGKPTKLYLEEIEVIPQTLSIKYYSIISDKVYNCLLLLSEMQVSEDANKSEYYLIGLSPWGGVACWLYSFKKSICILKEQGGAVPNNKDLLSNSLPLFNGTFSQYRQTYLKQNHKIEEKIVRYGLPPQNLFDNYMKQFLYRYVSIYEKWNGEKGKWMKYEGGEVEPVFDYIEESLFDGTHDKLHDGGLLKYHQAGKPKKLRIQWHIRKSEYSAYFWFEDERIREVFDKFYGAHPDTKTDFIIRIDAENRKYELALYRYGLKEPQVIPEDVYQLLVFKNKFEDYRSDNYNQERGAWIW